MLFSLIYFWRQLLRLPPPWLNLHDRFCDFPSQSCFINFKAVISRSVMFVMCSAAGLFHKRLGLRCDSIIDRYHYRLCNVFFHHFSLATRFAIHSHVLFPLYLGCSMHSQSLQRAIGVIFRQHFCNEWVVCVLFHAMHYEAYPNTVWMSEDDSKKNMRMYYLWNKRILKIIWDDLQNRFWGEFD
jgi:hypothetical protein